MRKLALIATLAWVVGCGRPEPPCTPGDCLRAYDSCHGADGAIVKNACDLIDCDDFGTMTEREAALIDARAICNDTDADRQLVRIGYNMSCSDTIEHLLAECQEKRRLHPHDPWTANCEQKFVRPYRHHWPSIEEYYDSVYGPPDPAKGERYP